MTGLTKVKPEIAAPGLAGGRLRKWVETLETGADDSTSSTYLVARLPSNARILGSSRISHDALGTTTATFNIGVYNVPGKSHITDDDDAINDGIVCSTSGTKEFIKDRADWGKCLWQFVSGATKDPQGMLDIKLKLTTAHLSSGAGTVTVEIDYTID